MVSTDSQLSTVHRPRVAVSSCLLGNPVRYDGNHARYNWMVDKLGRFVDFIPLCPEMSIGLGVPRKPVQLTGDPADPRVQGVVEPELDVTDALRIQGQKVAGSLDRVAGYVFKSRSPSCGLFRVKVHTPGGVERKGRGVYAAAILEACPQLPAEEEGRLNDVVLRENFVSRLYAYQRWLLLCDAGLTAERLLDFHTRHKYLVMAHSQAAYQRLGRLLSQLKGLDIDAVAGSYLDEFMPALARRVSPGRHGNALHHIMGYLKRRIGPDDKAELISVIDAYRHGDVPLVVPIMLLRHHFRRNPDDYIDMQWYLWPYPDELGLRNQL
jgi:uncharacterized protein YbgA (DUF1722 family)/uncharacterized protein YbbK (DUF523 family)